MTRVFLRGCSAAAVQLLFFAAAAFAQEFRATITGRVIDATGDGIPNANLTARELATNETFPATTGAGGNYFIPFLKPGNYRVTADAKGFKQAINQNVELHVNDKATVDFAMQVGEVHESITVTSESPQLEAASASRGGVIENMRVTELPLNGRNPIQLSNLTTGVQFSGNPKFQRPFDNGDNVNFSINGGLRQTNAYLLDGAPDEAVTDADGDRTSSRPNIAYIPSVDAVREFKIVTNFYDAQYGRTGGGIVNITTKSGANEIHGSAYEFLRRYQLDANDLGANAAGRPRYTRNPDGSRAGHKLDQYGTAITGPVWVPNLYNGKDKTFFLFGFENYLEDSPSPGLNSVPTAAERQGDFSKSGITIWDPFSTRENPNFDPTKADSASNPRYTRTQFANNVIPSSLLNPVGLAIAKAFPVPNFGVPEARFNNFIASPNLSRDRFKNWIGRVDQNFGQRERIFFRYAHNRRNQVDQGSTGFPGIAKDAQDPLTRINDTAVVDALAVLSPRAILNLRGGFTRFVQAAYRESVIGFDATSIGFPGAFSNARYTAIPPRIDFDSQYPSWGSRNPNSNITNLLSFQASLSHVRGSHSIKAGFDFRDTRANVSGGSFVWGGGEFRFTREFTQRLPAFPDSDSGSQIASLLLGAPSSGVISYVPQLAYRWPYYAVYLQDDVRVTQNVTLNLGLRYDMEGSPTERYDRMNRGFAFNQANPLAGKVRNAPGASECPACANLAGGLLFVGTGGLPRQAFDDDLNNWQPRIGAAYQVTSRTVLRGGYGIFYVPEAAYGGSAGFSIDTPFVATVGGGANGFIPANTLGNPFPSGLLNPSGSSLGLATFLGNNIIFNRPDRVIPYVHQFSFGVQHQLPWAVKADASYVGSRTRDINTNDFVSTNGAASNARNLNVNTAEQLARARQDSNYFNQQVTNPFAGLIPGTGLNEATIRRQSLLLPYPQFGWVQMGEEPVGRIWYDSLQLNIEKRFSDGLTFVAAYTLSKNLEAVNFLNDQDLKPSKALTLNDRTHRLVMSGVFQLPFGRGRRFSTGRLADWFAGGWEYNWIGIYQSGTPLDYPGSADLIGNPGLAGRNNDQWFNGCALQLNGAARQPNAAHNGFDPCVNPVWTVRAPFTLRTIPFRSGQIRQPWAWQWDMSLNKRFRLTERVNLQFRAEGFNVFNTPVRPGPNTDPDSPQFGFVPVGQRNFPRQVQLGFKANF